MIKRQKNAESQFYIICVIHNVSVLFKISRILATLLKDYKRLLLFKKIINFFHNI